MKDDHFRFLTLRVMPARLTAEQASWLLNCHVQHIPILVSARLLKPLGNPIASSVKYFATVELLERAKDEAWLGRVTNALSQHWAAKNERSRNRTSAPLAGLQPPDKVGLS